MATVLAVTSAALPGPVPERSVAGAGDAARHDASLVASIGAGDRHAAVGALYDRYAARLMGFGVRLLGDRGLAEELVQETFVRIWRAARDFDAERGTVTAWIFTIARHVAVDLHRRRARQAAPGTSPELAVDDAALESLVTDLTIRDALDALEEDHRAVLELAYHGGLTQSEVADRLAIPLGTVKSRTHQALAAMRVELSARGLHG